jgi:hypothetical protein
MEIMTARQIENLLHDFEEDQRNAIKEKVFTLPFALYWYVATEPYRN